MAEFFQAIDQFPVTLKAWLMGHASGVLPEWALPLVSAALSITPILAVFPLLFALTTVIERKGARTALLATEGARDVMDIGSELRYDVYDLGIRRHAFESAVKCKARDTPRARQGPKPFNKPRKAVCRPCGSFSLAR